MRAATTRIQHLTVAPAKVATALPQWTVTTKPRKLQPAHRCPRNKKLLQTALNSTQQSLLRYTVGASLSLISCERKPQRQLQDRVSLHAFS